MVVNIEGAVTGNASTATALQTARTIGGVSFDGTGNITLPGVNAGGNQATSGNAATATALATPRTIGGTSFDGTANIAITTNANLTGGVTSVGNATTVVTNANLTGDVTSTGNATAIASDVIINADVKSDAAIAMSKTALVGGTGLTLATNTLNVDAAQTQITSVGTIGAGTWQGTAVADAYIASAATWTAKEDAGVATAMAIALG